ncbi:hypothetical protein [Clostridium sp.]|uniref:hypothetical protein n=1 Tax=Clostridium sp. TaxID=1506 RepID=UPI0025C65950|nr:hypothetical protein [Clostridium sp.]
MKCQFDKKDLIYLIILLFITAMFIINKHSYEPKHKEKIIIDTIYNTVVLDSIKYNIKIKDSIIYSIKYEYEKKYEEINSINDSSAVELFKELCTNN